MAELPSNTTDNGTQSAQQKVLTLANGTADEVAVWRNDSGAAVNVTGVRYTPDTAVTGDATNNFALQLKSKTAAGAAAHNVTAVKTYAAGVDMTQWVADALVLSTTAADLRVEDGEVLTLDKTENGTGLTLPEGVVEVDYQFAGQVADD
jgi:hypothetical protein